MVLFIFNHCIALLCIFLKQKANSGQECLPYLVEPRIQVVHEQSGYETRSRTPISSLLTFDPGCAATGERRKDKS